MNTIWAPKLAGSACTKIPYKGYEISIAMDDSCGVMEDYRRSSICVFRDCDGENVTLMFSPEGRHELPADAETLQQIFLKIDGLTA